MRPLCIPVFIVSLILTAPQQNQAQGLLGNIKKKAQEKLQHEINSSPATTGSPSSKPEAGPAASAATDKALTATGASSSVYYKDPNQALEHDVYVGDADGCAAAVTRGADASKIPPGLTLHQGSANISLVRCLVEHGASPNRTQEASPDLLGDTPLILALDFKHYDIAEYLTSQGATVTAHGRNAALMNASQDSSSQSGYCNCMTALGIAAGSGNAAILELLIAHGADVHMKFSDRHSPPGRSVLDLAQIPLIEAARNYTNTASATTRATLDSDCAAYSALKTHGAEATAASYGHNGSPSCDISPQERATLSSEFSKEDAAHADNEQKRTLESCALNDANSFYDCTCFSKSIAAYRADHSATEPMASVLSHANYSSCIRPTDSMIQFGSKRASLLITNWHLTPQQNDSVSMCAGKALPAAFMAHPGIQTSVISSDFQEVFKSCREQYAR